MGKIKTFIDAATGTRVKLPRPAKRHRFKKQFGYSNEKWARGMGKAGYARCYGHNSPAYSNRRTRAELRANDARNDTDQ